MRETTDQNLSHLKVSANICFQCVEPERLMQSPRTAPQLRELAHTYYMERVHELYQSMQSCSDQFRYVSWFFPIPLCALGANTRKGTIGSQWPRLKRSNKDNMIGNSLNRGGLNHLERVLRLREALEIYHRYRGCECVDAGGGIQR